MATGLCAIETTKWYIEARKFVIKYISRNNFRAEALSIEDYMGILTHNDPDKEMLVYSSREIKKLIKDACDNNMWLTVHKLSLGFAIYPDFIGDENYWIVDLNGVYIDPKIGPMLVTRNTIRKLREDVIKELED